MGADVTRVVALLVAVGCVAAATAFAQTPPPLTSAYVDPVAGLTLSDAIRRGLEHEPELAAARAEVDMARGERRQASLRPNPMVSAVRQEQVRGMDTLSGVEIEWPLDLYRRGARVASADRAIAVAEGALADRHRERAAEIALAYTDLLASIRLLEVGDELVATDERTFDLLRARVDEGASPALERNMADVELRRAQADRFGRQADVETARARLRRLIGADGGEDVRVREPLEQTWAAFVVDTGPSDARTIADRRTDVRLAQADVAMAEARAREVEHDGRLDLTLTGSYMRMFSGFPLQGITEHGHLEPIQGVFHNVAFGATVNVPLRNRNQGAVAAARAAVERARYLYTARIRDAETELEAAESRERRTQQAAAVFASGLTAIARANLDVMREAYTIGAATLGELLQEQRRFLEVEIAHVEALRMALEARIALATARGVLR